MTSPHNDGTNVDVDNQRIVNLGGKIRGGYDPSRAGIFPWATPGDPKYIIAKGDDPRHAYTDSSSSATSMTSGIKTYNNAVNVDFAGREVVPIARQLQDDGWAVGVVTSVPISHATPASAYANNVHRNDYQDLTRDLLGLPSVFHPGALPGVDVLLGAGWGESTSRDGGQGKNFVPGNRYLSDADLKSIDVRHGGKYVVATRTAGSKGQEVLRDAAQTAIENEQRLFGYFGYGGSAGKGGHLPYQTADGQYDPVISEGNSDAAQAESYTDADLSENVPLAEMTTAALDVLQSQSDEWWLLVEAGDVDWGNHQNNIDNSIGAVLSGDEAFTQLVTWIEKNGGWDDTCVLVTADHGHYLVIDDPEALISK